MISTKTNKKVALVYTVSNNKRGLKAMKIKYGAVSALVMAQLSMPVSADDADGTITVTGIVTPTTCTINAPNYSFGTIAFNDVIESTISVQRQENNAVVIQCSDSVKASSLVFTGTTHSIADLAFTGSDGTVYTNGSIAYQPRIHTPDDAATARLMEVLGLVPSSICGGCSNPISSGRNLITSSGSGIFDTTPLAINMDHRLQSRGRTNTGDNFMPEDTYSTTMNIALTY